MNYSLFFILSFLLLSIGVDSRAQSITEATNDYNRFVKYYNSGQEMAAYAALHSSYENFIKVLDTPSMVAHHQQAKSTLKEIHSYLKNGAYYYTQQNNQSQALRMAQAFTDISIHPAMKDEPLERSGANYVSIVMMAAFNTYNKKDYAKAIPYLSTYLSTGDIKNREDAYSRLGTAYYQTKDYQQAVSILSQGLQLYPNNRQMLSVIINASGKKEDDATLQKFLPKAISMAQGDKRNLTILLNIQGQSYERTQNFELAADTYTKMRTLQPTDLNTARHLALDCYNTGVQYMNLSKQADSKSDSKRYKELSETYFHRAEPLLNEIIYSDPYNAAKYSIALANSYSCLGDSKKLQAMNEKIASMGYAPVSSGGGSTQLISMDAPTPKPIQSDQPIHKPEPEPKPIPPTPADVDVDINIAQTHSDNNNTFAVVIANENYTKADPVPLAGNDGKIFAEYCRKALGLPARNVREHYDVTSLEMEDALDDIKAIAKARKGNLNVIFYYAGHGVPDEGTKDAYLLPIDGRGGRTTGCMSLKELYDDLEALQANCVTVFLDACFSGGARGGGMVASARGVVIKPKSAEANGNMIIFSAVSGEETALPYKEQKHGLFTYYLLKKLRESGGNVTLGELSDYLTEEVALQAQLVNKKPQTPTVTPSLSLGDKWRSFKLTK